MAQAQGAMNFNPLTKNSRLPRKPHEDKIKTLLLHCLKEHYGRLGTVEYLDPTTTKRLIAKLKEALARYE